MSDAGCEQAGAETADAWMAILDRGETINIPWTLTTGYYALYGLDEAFAGVLGGHYQLTHWLRHRAKRPLLPTA